MTASQLEDSRSLEINCNSHIGLNDLTVSRPVIGRLCPILCSYWLELSNRLPLSHNHIHSAGTVYTQTYSIYFPDLPRADLSLGPTLDASRIKEGDDVYFECNIDAKPAIYKTSWWFNVSH